MTRSLLVRAPGAYSLVTGDPPDPGAGEVVVGVAAAGICGSDRELVEGTRPAAFARYPIVPGHEWSGVVTAAGPGVDPDLVGRPVAGEGFGNCQVCDRCREGAANLCSAGYDETGFTRAGAFADSLVLPARLLHVLPGDADLRAAALLEPASVAAAAVLTARVEPGERVAVVGAGTLGALCLQLLRLRSPVELAAADPRAGRTAVALACGATHAGAGPLESGAYDVVIETAGVAGSAAAAIALARRGGRVVLTGIPGEDDAGTGAAVIVGGQLTVSGVFGASPSAWTHAVRLFAAGLLDLGSLVTHELGLEEFGRAMELLRGSRDDVGKILLRP
ncbi:alcohol dehydrogenase catalytic domain-containing protein [Actinomadura sp. DC4]|uniref:zinc-dependent alcohol dehydrogenase n=1 Tax=Actinomadura sp. DC4 TaxID=3055069 RepID=UPI0025AF842A|nr:alcohol dehydrogenase catalytic domain-containing protein [Actinomadura sp. DC4]MDN3356325.1 alcohol dehydrogenase catalytic domain-containing protein [Actinomadura sp. DC4]